MEILALLFIVGVANAGRLENSYLPPGGLVAVRPGAGGSGFVQAPSGLFNGVYNAVQAQSGSSSAGSYREYSAGRSGQAVAITRYDNQNVGDGSYKYNYETANGISAEETGATRGDGQSVAGFYSYTGTDGQKYTVHYTADENGFHPEGAHLPTPPPIPEEIRRGVELSLAAEARGENQGGSSQFYNKYQGSSGGYSY